MMPYLQETRSRREIVDTFGGVNKSKLIREGEWSETQNISLDNYPVFSVKKKHGFMNFYAYVDALIVKGDKLYYLTAVDQTSNPPTAGKLYEYDNSERESVEIKGIDLQAVDGHKLVSFGAYLIILPEKIWINTAKAGTGTDTYEHGEIEAECNYTIVWGGGGAAYRDIHYSDQNGSALQISINKSYVEQHNTWLFYDVEAKKLYKASTNDNKTTWEEYAGTVETTVDFGGRYEPEGEVEPINCWQCDTIGSIEPEDYITITETYKDNNSTKTYEHGYFQILKWYPNSYGSFSVNGVLIPRSLFYDGETLSFVRKIPKTDFIFESNNRLWGCRYGENNDGENVNEIYASALGDFKNWSKYAGVSTDSYAASIGTDGPFTGACAYLGYPTFFKEDYIHKVYGAYPAQYQIQTTSCPGTGVMKGCDRSLAVCDHILYYKARNCICAYDGNYPVSVSSALGDEQFKLTNGIAGACRGKYHISLTDTTQESTPQNTDTTQESTQESTPQKRFIYYPNLRKWTESEVDNPTTYYQPFADDLLYSSGDNCYTFYGSNPPATPPPDVAWSATSGLWQITSPDKKYVSKLVIRMKLPASSTFKAEIEYDSSGSWTNVVSNLTGNNLASFNLPILPRRCDHLRLRLSGTGDCEIYSITKTIENGSDI